MVVVHTADFPAVAADNHDLYVVARSETAAAPLGAIFASTSKIRVTCDNSSHPLTENIKR
jgi:hypothetical protein